MATKAQTAKRKKVSAARRQKEHTSGFTRTSWKPPAEVPVFQPKKGTYRLEVIPFEVTDAIKKFVGNCRFADPGDLYYEQTFFVHRNVGADPKEAYVCLAKTLGKPCPVCELRGKLALDPKADEKLIKGLAPKERQLWIVFDHNEADKGVQVWETSYHLFGKYLEAKLEKADSEDKEKWQAFADPEDGMTLRVGFNEETAGEAGKFIEASDIELRDRKEALDPDLFKHGIDLSACVTVLPYTDLKKILLQEGDNDDAESDDDEPAPGKADEEDEPTPAKKPAGKKPAPKEEEEEEPEPEEIGKGDEVSFLATVKGKEKRVTGTVVKVNAAKGLAQVSEEGRDAPHVVKLTELTKAGAEEEEEPADDDWGDDDDEPAGKKGGDEDDIPFDEEDEDEPKPSSAKKPAGKKK